jgi:hypothetical protein
MLHYAPEPAFHSQPGEIHEVAAGAALRATLRAILNETFCFDAATTPHNRGEPRLFAPALKRNGLGLGPLGNPVARPSNSSLSPNRTRFGGLSREERLRLVPGRRKSKEGDSLIGPCRTYCMEGTPMEARHGDALSARHRVLDRRLKISGEHPAIIADTQSCFQCTSQPSSSRTCSSSVVAVSTAKPVLVWAAMTSISFTSLQAGRNRRVLGRCSSIRSIASPACEQPRAIRNAAFAEVEPTESPSFIPTPILREMK